MTAPGSVTMPVAPTPTITDDLLPDPDYFASEMEEDTIEMSYSPAWAWSVYDETYRVWFTTTFNEMLEQRAKGQYVYDFDKDQHAAWFTTTLKDFVDERARNGYVYALE